MKLLLALLFCASAQDTLITEFSGSGTKNTRPFTVPNRWVVKWDAKQDININIMKAAGDGIEDPGDVGLGQWKPGSGESFKAKGGEYYLGVTSTGAWTIKVLKVSP